MDDTNDDFEFSDENIMKIMDVNEIKSKSSYPVIAAVERCHYSKPAFKSTREKWYQKYSLSEGYCKDTEFSNKPKYQIGDEVSSIEAVNDPKLDYCTLKESNRA